MISALIVGISGIKAYIGEIGKRADWWNGSGDLGFLLDIYFGETDRIKNCAAIQPIRRNRGG